MHMTVRTDEKRRSVRMPAAYPVVLRDRRGRLLARGRTANFSETGVYVLVRPYKRILSGQELHIELTLPNSPFCHSRRDVRVVVYVCRVTRSEELGSLAGFGIELLRKLI